MIATTNTTRKYNYRAKTAEYKHNGVVSLTIRPPKGKRVDVDVVEHLMNAVKTLMADGYDVKMV